MRVFAKKSLLFLLLGCFLLSFWACEKKNDDGPKFDSGHITVFSDTHVMAYEQYGDTVTPGFARKLNSNEKAIGLTEAILKTAVDDFIASDSAILILTGDLTDDGAKVAHQAVARELKRAEAAGKRCYVINGNHDIHNGATSYLHETTEDIDNVSPEDFAEIYADFGYSEALTRDPDSLSYTAELNDKYRLVAWDIAKYDLVPGTTRSVDGRHDPHITQEKLDWLDEQLEKCFFDKKEPFLITHFPILSHIGPLVGSLSHVNMQKEALAVLQAGNVSFSFCGHVHQQDIATYEFADRNYYEIETGSLSYTTLPIRHFIDDGEEVKITTTQQSYVKEEYVPSFYSAEEKASILANLPAYVWNYENSNFANYVYGKLYYDDVCGVFGITDEDAFDLTESVVKAFYYTPLYEKDADGGKSIEGISASHGVTNFPVANGAKTVGELIISFIKNSFAGDEKTSVTQAEVQQLKYALYAACHTFGETKLLSKLGLTSEKDASLVKSVIDELYATGRVEIVQSGVFGILTEIPALKNNSAVKRLNILSGTPEEIAVRLNNLLVRADGFSQFLPEGTIKDVYDSLCDEEKGLSYLIDFTKVEETGKGYLNIDALLEKFITVIGVGILNDDGAPDNNFTFSSPHKNH